MRGLPTQLIDLSRLNYYMSRYITSLSPNHVVASLLDELIKNTYPKAAIKDPKHTTSNFSIGVTIYLNQAPKSVIPAPIVN